MRAPTPTSHAASSHLITGLILLFCALTFYYFAVLRFDYRKSTLLDLRPGPDVSEYFAQANSLLNEGRPYIHIGYDKLPSTFPPGYPALMLPWLKWLPPSDSALAPFRTNQTLGLLLLLIVFCFYTYLAMPLTGGFASLLLATIPGFVTFCRSSLSDTSSWVFFTLAFMFAYLGLKEERRWKIYLSAVFLGFGVDTRMQCLFFFPLLLSIALFPMKGNLWRWLFHCCAVALVFALMMSPMLLANSIKLKSHLALGGFWYPPEVAFSLQFVPTANVPMFWRELTLQQNGFFAANVFGSGTVFVPAFVLLIMAGLFFVRLERSLICIFLALLSFIILTAIFRVPDGRYYLQPLLLLTAVAVLPVVWAVRNIFVRKWTVSAIGIFILFAATCLGYPSRSGYNRPPTNRSQAWDALHFGPGLNHCCLMRNGSLRKDCAKNLGSFFRI